MVGYSPYYYQLLIIPSSCYRVKKYYHKRNQQIDYNKEIPFEKKPAPGFYDTSKETVENEEPDFKRLKRSDVDGVRRSAEEEVGSLFISHRILE